MSEKKSPHVSHHPSVDPSLLFKGRPGDPRVGEWVKPIRQLNEIASTKREVFVLLGCPDDTGVKNNRGRVGAKEGPDNVRKHLYKLCPPGNLKWEDRIELYDWGNISPADNIIETHRRAQAAAHAISAHGFVGIAVGGGHDFAAPLFTGFASEKKGAVGLTNVDPHLDMRPLENGIPNSGTPFRQLLDSKVLKGSHFLEFGIRANRNARGHFDYAKTQKVEIAFLEDLKMAPIAVWKEYKKRLGKLAKKVPSLATTFCMDACQDTEGTSAAPVLGFSALEMVFMAEMAGREKKVRWFEIAEVCPPLDATERAGRIAAEMIYAFLKGRAADSKTKR